MKPAFRIILALSFSLAACGHSKPELSLDQTTTALECASSHAPGCPASGDADAGSLRPELDECYGDGDCEYGEVCERRHGLSLCLPGDGRHGRDDGNGGHGGDDRPDGGAPTCAPTDAADHHSTRDDDCNRDDGDRDEDRSGSNSGRH